MIPQFLRDIIRARPSLRPFAVRIASLLASSGVRLVAASRETVNSIYGKNRENLNDDFILGMSDLHAKIKEILLRYRADTSAFKYFYGYPYQGLAIASVFGDRLCDYRFDDYELRKFVKPSDRLLDVGCNCGFIAILASYRIGCKSHGIDINPYMIEIGNLVAKHLRVSDLVTLESRSIHDFKPEPFDVVTCFATHWTDDNNYRVSIDDHLARMASYLKSGGTLIFETHTADTGNAEFYAAVDATNNKVFSFDGVYKPTDGGSRELYVMKRI